MLVPHQAAGWCLHRGALQSVAPMGTIALLNSIWNNQWLSCTNYPSVFMITLMNSLVVLNKIIPSQSYRDTCLSTHTHTQKKRLHTFSFLSCSSIPLRAWCGVEVSSGDTKWGLSLPPAGKPLLQRVVIETGSQFGDDAGRNRGGGGYYMLVDTFQSHSCVYVSLCCIPYRLHSCIAATSAFTVME